jgi:TolB-like protein
MVFRETAWFLLSVDGIRWENQFEEIVAGVIALSKSFPSPKASHGRRSGAFGKSWRNLGISLGNRRISGIAAIFWPKRVSRGSLWGLMLYHFDRFSLDSDRRELRRDGTPISVEPKVFDLMVYLVDCRDRVVSKDDLINTVWHGRIVSESALATCINAARAAFGDSGEEQRLIKTFPRKGLRFVATVLQGPVDHPTPALLPAYLALPDRPSTVLPFQNMSSEPEQEYFADGIVTDIIMGLARIKWLFVISRNSSFVYKHRPTEVKQIGRELGVRYVLEGSIRKSGSRVRIAAQLIDAENGAHIWAERYDRQLDDIFALQTKYPTRWSGQSNPIFAMRSLIECGAAVRTVWRRTISCCARSPLLTAI